MLDKPCNDMLYYSIRQTKEETETMYTISYAYMGETWETSASTLNAAIAELARVRQWNHTAVLLDADGYIMTGY